jgi:hypothetical protein
MAVMKTTANEMYVVAQAETVRPPRLSETTRRGSAHRVQTLMIAARSGAAPAGSTRVGRMRRRAPGSDQKTRAIQSDVPVAMRPSDSEEHPRRRPLAHRGQTEACNQLKQPA